MSADGLLLAFYGDDFTGSTDAMEALARSGLRAILCLSVPDPRALASRFPGVRCIGLAGTSRAMSPPEMDADLAPALDALWALGAPLLHYKVCSTFDSSPAIGNIGHVVDMARRRLNGGRTVSVLAGAPPLRRYTVFGNHFAAAGDEVHRLDRHPTMSRHPTTPMHEADLRGHLAAQTSASIALMSVVDQDGDRSFVDARYAERMRGAPGMLLYDVLDDRRLLQAGRLLWEEAARAPHFAVGSSGVEYALAAHWRAAGLAPHDPPAMPRTTPVRQLLVMSGSASPATAEQIGTAEAHGFRCLRAPAERLVSREDADGTCREIVDAALAALRDGLSVVVYSARGPDDPSIGATRSRLAAGDSTARRIGSAMGRITRALVAQAGLRRVVIAGGDTSSYAAQELGLIALEMLAELAPGAPLCRGYSDDPAFDGLEIALKGGQMGRPDFFVRARDG
jgi:3-oxoisoapionate kinase